MLLGLRSEAQFVNVINNFTQVVAALNLVLYLTENFPDLVLDRVRATRR